MVLRSFHRYLLSKLNESQMRRIRRLRRPALMGSLRRMRPLSEHWGTDRGTPIDRYYIDHFIGDNREVVRGKVLEIRDSRYATRFGDETCMVDVLDVAADNPKATVIVDLAAADVVPSDTYDCIILTQTLQYIFDHHAAIRHLHRMLRPTGTILVTVPALSRMYPRAPETDFWRYTVPSLRGLLTERFGPQPVSVASFGNLLTGLAFMVGMAAEELRAVELDHHDPEFPLIIAARATKLAPTS